MRIDRPFNAARLVAAVDPADFESLDSDCPGFWTYAGDLSLECGGTFYNLDPADLKYGYCSAIRVTDLESACGYRGAVMIERVTVLGLDDKARISQALDCCGWISESARVSFACAILCAIEGLLSYGYYDPEFDAYRPHTLILQTDPDGDLSFDGWIADRYQTRGNLRGFILAKMLD